MSEEENEGTAIVSTEPTRLTTQQFEDAGLLMPVADPAALRAAFQQRQKILTSILDPDHDFLYVVRYVDHGKQQQFTTPRLAAAKKFAEANGVGYEANPKKSGVMKLAHALGIEARQIEVHGLPKDPQANFSHVKYIAVHKRTGRSEEGIGYCDQDERGGRLGKHTVISMADTRAYIRAVLRCAGYAQVGAEEIENDSGNDTDEQYVIEASLPARRDVAPPALMASTQPYGLMSDALGKIASQDPVPESAKARVDAAKAQSAAQPVPSKPASGDPWGLGGGQKAEETAETPAPSIPKGDVITGAQAKELSELLLVKLGSKDKAQEWLKKEAGVDRSIHVTESKLGELMKKLRAMEVV